MKIGYARVSTRDQNRNSKQMRWSKMGLSRRIYQEKNTSVKLIVNWRIEPF